MNSLRGVCKTIPDQEFEKESTIAELLSTNKGTYEIEMTLKPENSTDFGFELKNSMHELLKFTFDLKTSQLKVDRDKSGKTDFNDKFKTGASAPLQKKDSYKVRLLIDKASAELFINDGEIAMTNMFFPTEIMNTLTFFSHEGKLKAENVKIYNLK
jgi:fructan beta-fructosidase